MGINDVIAFLTAATKLQFTKTNDTNGCHAEGEFYFYFVDPVACDAGDQLYSLNWSNGVEGDFSSKAERIAVVAKMIKNLEAGV